jgi:hypothetical protein
VRIDTDKKGRQVLLCLPSDDPQGMKELTQNMLGKRKGERSILPHCNEEIDSSDGEGCSGLDERRGGARNTPDISGESASAQPSACREDASRSYSSPRPARPTVPRVVGLTISQGA